MPPFGSCLGLAVIGNVHAPAAPLECLGPQQDLAAQRLVADLPRQVVLGASVVDVLRNVVEEHIGWDTCGGQLVAALCMVLDHTHSYPHQFRFMQRKEKEKKRLRRQ